MSDARAQAAEVAAHQHGVISARQAADAGLSLGHVRTFVESGVWKRRWREVYTVAGAPTTYETDVMVACFVGGLRAMACRGTVARLLGIGRPYFDAAAVEIALPRGASPYGARALGAAVHVHRRIDDADRASIGLDPGDERPAARCRPARRRARRSSVRGHRRPAPAALEVARRDPPLLGTGVAAPPGTPRGRALAVVPGPKPGSPKEMSLCRVLQLHGLPRPVRQHPVRIPGRSRPRLLDLAYLESRVAPEYDGRREHGVRRWEHDAEREDELASVGWIRLPAGWSHLTEPGATISCDEVRAALTARAPAA